MPSKKEHPAKPPKPKVPARKPVRPGKGKDKDEDKDAGYPLDGISVKGDGPGEHPTATSKDPKRKPPKRRLAQAGLSVRADGSGEHP
jgi:hypothetical protein